MSQYGDDDDVDDDEKLNTTTAWKLFHSLSLFEFLCNIKSSKLLNNRVKKGFFILLQNRLLCEVKKI